MDKQTDSKTDGSGNLLGNIQNITANAGGTEVDAVCFAAQCQGKLRRKMVEGISCLLDHGADPNLADDRGETSFTSALKLHQRDIAELLFLSGVKFRSRIH